MDLLKLQYFKDVFEFQSFTKAADKNFVHQSAVTQQIAAIEKELGTLLFNRERGKITCTPAGKLFYQECCTILEKHTSAVNKIKTFSSGETQTPSKLTIGFSGLIDNNFTFYINSYLKHHPDITIDFIVEKYPTLCSRLINQDIDLIFGTACKLENIPGSVFKVLFTSPQKVLLSPTNPLAQKDILTMDELEGQTLIVPSYDMMPSCHRKGLQIPRRTKYKMNIEFVDSFEALKLKVSSNQGISFIIDSFAENPYQFKTLPIYNTHFVCTLGVSYLKSNLNPLTENFVRYISRLPERKRYEFS